MEAIIQGHVVSIHFLTENLVYIFLYAEWSLYGLIMRGTIMSRQQPNSGHSV